MADSVAKDTAFDASAFCEKFKKVTGGSDALSSYGLPIEVSIEAQFSGQGPIAITFYCADPEKMQKDVLVEKLTKMAAFFKSVFDAADALDPVNYKLNQLSDVRAFKMAGDEDKGTLQFGLFSRSQLTNSSTNFDRKRAAYMLKTFFCDDLTPIGVDIPVDKPVGKHGTDEGCFACHYKLEPMAVFLKITASSWSISRHLKITKSFSSTIK